jgi:N-acetylglucosaminyl-diphospho-decaprenol L-rhamnosyltransferase
MEYEANLDIVIVNWNSKHQLLECLETVEKAHQRYRITNVIVIDNASNDGSVDHLEKLTLPLHLVRNSRNNGFSAACNQGASLSKAEFVLFLNPDTKISEESLRLPIQFMINDGNQRLPKIGICGVRLVDDLGITSPSCSRFPNPLRILATMLGLRLLFPTIIKKELMSDWDHTTSKVVDQIKGAFFLVNRNLFNSLSGFDERFFVYYEEVDFSYRAKAAGWDSFFLSTTQIYHRGCGTTDSIKGKALFYFLRSRILYIRKHFSFTENFIHIVGTLTIEFIARIIRAFLRGSFIEIAGTFEAYRYLYQWFFFRKDDRWSI